MPIRARVGRHTRAGGRHCQNWVDDQKTVVDLLNRISTANGGQGQGLRPRIVAGIASNDLYAAITAFEAKNFPGQHLGYFDPGGPMFKKLEALGTPAAAPSAPAPAPVAAAAPVVPEPDPIPRLLTRGEKELLFPIFENTLDYDNQTVDRNDSDEGGEYNNFTPGYFPNMSRHMWSRDYSTEITSWRAIFVHEMVHVWQSGHGSHNLLRGAYLYIKFGGDYEKAYKYNLDSSATLSDFNLEQQAAIIEDYYRVFKLKDPESNIGARRDVRDYAPYVAQLKNAGPFRWPVTRESKYDNIGNKI